ncbi:kinase-like domain-containing protein [Pavlovales sp. CCMP2436]|nr:kinase-like domain-containing protein [Pavlovales sp. CCMP2436]
MPLFDDVPGGEYATVKKLGKGSYGVVYLVRNKKTSDVVCLKKMSLKAMGELERTRALQEAKLLYQLNHPNIVAYVDSFVAKSKLYLFMQFCEGGDLDARLVKMRATGESVPEALVLDWASQMAFALSYLHDKKVTARSHQPQVL